MSHGGSGAGESMEVSLVPSQGWHCSHCFFRFDRAALAAMSAEQVAAGRQEFVEVLDPQGADAPQRLQTSLVAGNKADFGLMLMDGDPLRIEAVRHRLLASRLGPAIAPAWSFVSLTEISEYVPTVEQYSKRLVEDGDVEGSPAHQAKVKRYADMLPMMNRQRLTPDFPAWPATCFYPMNKKRDVGENWFLTPFSVRNKLMSEHALSGRAFAGKVSQLITVGVGLDDWEWGVTLWARNPQFLTEIVYRMRFDEASARYAEFGPFYTSYVVSPSELLDRCRVAAR
jgi:chlorite dismutase